MLRTAPLKTAKLKNTPVPQNLRNEWIRGLQTAQKTTPQEKSWVEAGPGKQRERIALRREKGALLSLNRTEQHRARIERIVATGNKRQEKKRSNAKDPHKSAKNNTVSWKTSAMSLKEVLISESSHTKY